MSSTHWSKFFWSDWDQDPALRQCSLAAQGLWMRMLCICAASEPHGYVAVNGRPLDTASIAAHVGRPVDEIETLLSELEHWGVFSRDGKGRIYSRRMVRDQKRAENGRKSAKKRWAQPTEKQQKIPLPNGSPWKEPEAISHKPEAIEPSQPSSSSEPREPDKGGAGLGERCDDLRNRLCEAAGWEAQRANGGLEVVGPILELIDAGASLELDVLPTVKCLAARCRSPNWRFFIPAIVEARDTRLAAREARAPPGATVVPFHVHRHQPSPSLRQFQAIAEVFDEEPEPDDGSAAGAVPRLSGPGADWH